MEDDVAVAVAGFWERGFVSFPSFALVRCQKGLDAEKMK